MLFSTTANKRKRNWRDELNPKKKGEVQNDSWETLKSELEEREKLEARNKRRIDRESDLLSFTDGTHDKKGLPFVWMDIEIGPDLEHPLDKPGSGRFVFELFTNICPRTCENFIQLCLGKSSAGKYQESIFHKIVPGGAVFGGDIGANQDGTSGRSIYGATFEDENYDLKVTNLGVLFMENRGVRNNNGSVFGLSFKELPEFAGNRVVFGRIHLGVDVLREMEYSGQPDGKPKRKIQVLASGLCDPKAEVDSYWKKMVLPQDSNHRESLKIHQAYTQMRDCGVGTFY